MYKIIIIFFSLLMGFSCTHRIYNIEKPSIFFNFDPSDVEKEVLTIPQLSAILPNYPKGEKLRKDPSRGDISLYKSLLIPPQVYYIAIYFQPLADQLYFDEGTTFAILQIENNHLVIRYKSLGLGTGSIGDITFIDFDKDMDLDIYLIVEDEGQREAALYQNNDAQFRNDMLYFTNYHHSEYISYYWPQNMELKDYDNDGYIEFKIETDIFSRLYKWNGEVFVLKEKLEIKKK